MPESPSPFRRSEAVVDARIDAVRMLLIRINVSPTEAREVLLHPELHWRRHRLESGRSVYSPSDMLRKLHARLIDGLNRLEPRWTELAQVATAFHPGDSTFLNAKAHAHEGRRSSLMLDLSDAFGSVERRHIERYARGLGLQGDVAWIAARLFTHEGRLRQGAPVAPHLFNMLLNVLDLELCDELCAPLNRYQYDEDWAEAGFIYTRYADDLCFSCTMHEFPSDWEDQIRSVIARHGFGVNESKTIRGSNGVLHFPGVVIRDGLIGPNDRYVRRAMRAIKETDDPNVVHGHKAYIGQFHPKMIPRRLRRRLDQRLDELSLPY